MMHLFKYSVVPVGCSLVHGQPVPATSANVIPTIYHVVH
jgi:hypothetical protein